MAPVNRTRALAAALALAALLPACASKDDCRAPEIRCGDRCLDGSSDPLNCGACGNACGAGTTCCGGACVDTQVTEAHCGGCGHACPVNGTCTAGTCACPDTLPTQCGASPGTCVNLTTGAGGYCGQCGWVCAATGVSDQNAPCVAGACVCAGTPEATDCGNGGSGQCVNTLTDERNCGGCGAQDPASVCKPHARCVSGACVCADAAFPDSCPSGCVDLRTDRSNCGSCGNACSGTTPACSEGLCCPTGRVNCAGTCVDTRTSAANCGACGHGCSAGQTCADGRCVCEGARPTACGATCCAGTACCAGNTCQVPHSNGLGGSFFDCHALYAPAETTLQLAQKAADAWNAGSDYFGLCGGDCVGRQTATSCAIWCYGLSTYRGRVTSGATPVCTGLCANFIGATPTWQ